MALKVGDRIKWCDAPRWSLVGMDDSIAWCRGDDGMWLQLLGEWQSGVRIPRWRRDFEAEVVVVALDVPADATAKQLRELAERFEVRKALMVDRGIYDVVLAHWLASVPSDLAAVSSEHAYNGPEHGPTRDELLFGSDLLYRTGWRPGMTAEDAARLLAEKR